MRFCQCTGHHLPFAAAVRLAVDRLDEPEGLFLLKIAAEEAADAEPGVASPQAVRVLFGTLEDGAGEIRDHAHRVQVAPVFATLSSLIVLLLIPPDDRTPEIARSIQHCQLRLWRLAEALPVAVSLTKDTAGIVPKIPLRAAPAVRSDQRRRAPKAKLQPSTLLRSAKGS